MKDSDIKKYLALSILLSLCLLLIFSVLFNHIHRIQNSITNMQIYQESIRSELRELRLNITALNQQLSPLQSNNSNYVEIDFKVTAYCPCEKCCGRYSDGLTSTNTDAYSKGVAVDPQLIPYGIVLDIPEYGKVIADDCGGAIKGNRLDVRFKTHQEALNWGVRHLTVKVYEYGGDSND